MKIGEGLDYQLSTLVGSPSNLGPKLPDVTSVPRIPVALRVLSYRWWVETATTVAIRAVTI